MRESFSDKLGTFNAHENTRGLHNDIIVTGQVYSKV